MTISVKDSNGTPQTIQTGPAPGQALMAASTPVAIASDQSAIPVSGPTGAAAFATDAKLASVLAAETASMFFAPVTTPLAASATFTGATRDVGVAPAAGHPLSYFNATFYADQIGTAFIDLSDDGTTWLPAATAALAVTTPLILSVPILARYYRARLVNGATAQGAFRASTSFTRS